MKLLLTFFVLLMGYSTRNCLAATVPSDPIPLIKSMKAGDLEKVTGKKLNLWQKVKFEAAKRVMMIRMKEKGEMTEKQRRQSIVSMILGICSLVFLFLPGIAILSIPAAILAVIFGIMSLKGNSNAKGIVGIVTGGLVLLLLLVVLAWVAAMGFY
jgi:hypothetical protein